jgi:hypothetical protein
VRVIGGPLNSKSNLVGIRVLPENFQMFAIMHRSNDVNRRVVITNGNNKSKKVKD